MWVKLLFVGWGWGVGVRVGRKLKKNAKCVSRSVISVNAMTDDVCGSEGMDLLILKLVTRVK